MPVFAFFTGIRVAWNCAWLCAGNAAHEHDTDLPPAIDLVTQVAFGPESCFTDRSASDELKAATAALSKQAEIPG